MTARGAGPVDGKLLYDTLLVSWVLGLALYAFALGREAGARGWPRLGR